MQKCWKKLLIILAEENKKVAETSHHSGHKLTNPQNPVDN